MTRHHDPTTAELIASATSWWCEHGHLNVTWEQPPPSEGEQAQCVHWGHDGLELNARVARMTTGIPFGYVREILGPR